MHARITPAYAGKTRASIWPSTTQQDHPRVCGKDAQSVLKDNGQRGSPPRMRERLVFLQIAFNKLRITPAYAGKTCLREGDCVLLRDHPRVCGKDSQSKEYTVSTSGSPPRMRERQDNTRSAILYTGITPAYAGKTLKNPNKIATSSKRNNQIYLLFKANSSL